MEQYARKRYFSTIAVGHIDNLTWREDPPVRGVHPLLILRDVLADTTAWLYTKTLIIGYLEDPSGEGFIGEEEAELDEAEFQDVVAQLRLNTGLLKKVLEVQQYLYPGRGETDLKDCPEATEWTRRILSGDMSAAASLLIAILPRVQKIRIVEYYRILGSHYLLTLDDLLHAAVSDKHKPTGINSFSNLTEVGVHGAFVQCGASYDLFEGFMKLPSMRTIMGRLIAGEDAVSYRGGLTEPSNVTSLEFHHSAIDAESFSSSLCATNGLQNFAFNFWAGAFMDDQLWEPRQILWFEFGTRRRRHRIREGRTFH